jgi:enoyl-CoA hydratase/3-hydroxyacyl-CoA dehydrogenase
MFVFKAAVVGAGTMGGEIAQAIAAADIPVVLKDVDQKFVDVGLQKAREVTERQVRRLVKKEKITEEQGREQVEAVLGRITGTTSYDDFGDVDFVVEAVPERMEIKQAVFGELDDVTPGHAILATNTSSLSITEIGDATSRPEKVVGFHFFYPASVMPLLEIVIGDETDPETVAAAVNFAQAIRKQPITCHEVPGFVVNRILTSSLSEIHRAQEEDGLSIQKIDQAVQEAKRAPMGPFFLVDQLGLDTVLHVSEHLAESYASDRFYVHQGMKRLVAEKQLGAKTGGSGFYKDGEPQLPGDADPPEDLPDRMALKAVREACLLLEEGVAHTRAIDVGMMAGAGMDPRRGIMPPLLWADVTGLDVVAERLEELAGRFGEERFAPPAILRRFVRQGRLGMKSGQGFFPWPRPDEGFAEGPVQLETRGDIAIAWLNNPPANSLSPDTVRALARVWEEVDGKRRALVIASANPLLFCAGADIKAFTTMDAAAGRELLDLMHDVLRSFERSSTVTIAAVNAIAYGGGCELAMACDVRIAADSALFGQPEINLGIIPGFGGTQRLPRLVGASKALEMNLTGDALMADDAFMFGLANEVVPDHELLDTALAWAHKLGGQAPLAVQQIKQVSAAGDLDAGIEAEKAGFATVFATEDAREGIGAFLAKRSPRWQGR